MIRDRTNGKIKDFKALLVFVDGSCEPVNPGGVASYGWVIYDENKKILAEGFGVVQDGGPLATNNYAEYCSLGFALKFLCENEWRGDLTVHGDSKLLMSQVPETWRCNAPHLQRLRKRIWEQLDSLGITRTASMFIWIPREQNSYADELATDAYRKYLQNKKDTARNGAGTFNA